MSERSARWIDWGARAAGRALAAALLSLVVLPAAWANGDTRTISLHHIHTGENITITYKKDGQYDEAALKKLDRFVRDWRKDEEVRMDPRLYDIMWEIQKEVGHKGPIHIVCGYRSPATNAMLRRRSSGVARTSLHMHGKAMDFSLPGADVAAVRAAALRIQGGGVGYYPTSGIPFVHVDVGSVRHWPRMTREQLAKIFPDGRTLHVPADGHPMPGYQLALADAQRGNADRLAQPKSRSLLAALFGGAQDTEEIADTAETTTPAAPRSRVALAPAKSADSVPLPPQRPNVQPQRPSFQLAAAESRPVTLPPRVAQPVNVASATPNDVINLRGFWQGPHEPSTVGAGTLRREDPITTSGLGALPNTDRVPPEIALAFASPGHPISDATLAVPALVTNRGDTSIAVKPPATPVHAVSDRARLDDPWVRALLLAGRLSSSMTVTAFGAPDYRRLRKFMEKPESSVLMTFSADPHLGMRFDRFTGSAVVFYPTVTYSLQTAALSAPTPGP